MGSTYNLKRSLAGAAALSLILNAPCWTALAQSSGGAASEELTLAAGPLGDVLSEISLRTGTPIIFAEDLVAGRQAPSVSGAHTAAEAARLALAGSGLEVRASQSGALRVVRVAAHSRPVAEPPVKRPEPETAEPLRAEAELRIDQVSVTGTSLRGIAPESSPLQIYSRADILGSGVTTTEQFIRTLPQNFGGGSSEFARNGLPNDDTAVQNYSFGTGANLRGLGSGATLILLNGQRLAPTSAIGDFVDLSMIPVSALERVDVLTDGASSIYGGDAVAGVINFVLREDFDGGETALRAGAVTQGDMKEYRVSQTLGKGWAGGNLLGTYEYFERENLTLSDRPGIRPPRLANGDPIPSPERFDLMPAQDRHSGLLSFNQDLGDAFSVRATGLYARRTTQHSGVNYTGLGLLVDSEATSESTAFSLSGDYQLSETWSARLTGNFSQMENATATRSSNQPLPAEFDFRSDVGSVDFVLNGGLFRLPGGAVQMAAGGQMRQENFSLASAADGLLRKGARDVSAVYGEIQLPIFGPDNRRPGLERLELNLSGRLDDYSDFGRSGNPKIGLLWSPAEAVRLRSSYSESFTPPALGYTGDRSSTGAILPTSFVINALGLAGRYPELEGTDLLIVSGIAEDLEPQVSQTFTAGIEFDRDWGERMLSASLNYYSISFEQRLGTVPIPGNVGSTYAPFIAFDDPAAFPAGTILFNPSPDEVLRLVNSFDRPVEPRLGGTIGNVGIINNASVRRNLAATRTRGLDLQLDSQLDVGPGMLSAGLNANYILDFTQQASVTTPEVDVLNTLFNPVDLQARAYLAWAQGSFRGRAAVNYTDGYQTDSTDMAVKMPSWTTLDLVASYQFSAQDSGLLKDAEISLSVLNLFDAAPPPAPSLGRLQIAGYDPTNASPLGRFVAIELRKTF